jgi:hypothetical protein
MIGVVGALVRSIVCWGSIHQQPKERVPYRAGSVLPPELGIAKCNRFLEGGIARDSVPVLGIHLLSSVQRLGKQETSLQKTSADFHSLATRHVFCR